MLLRQLGVRSLTETSTSSWTAVEDGHAKEHGVKLTVKRKKLLQTSLAAPEEAAEPVIKKIHKAGRMEPDPIRGLVESAVKGKRCVVEYESDTDLRDTEQVPLLEAGGIEAFLRREVLPYAPDAWYDPAGVKTGYEISFTRYFYKPQPMRSLEEIRSRHPGAGKGDRRVCWGRLSELMKALRGRQRMLASGAEHL